MQPQNFDIYASTYDNHFTYSLIGKEQRNQVYKKLKHIYNFKSKNILEVNCGTGEDAVWLAKQGAFVFATDISKGMIDVAKKKTDLPQITFEILSAQHIIKLYPKKFDMIFSNFGGLNCLSKNDLLDFEKQCSVLQDSGSLLAFVIMGSDCVWERFFFNWRNEPEKARRRQNKNGVNTKISNNNFLTYYHSPNDIIDFFKDSYNVKIVKPIGLFVPPSYLEDYFKKRKIIFSFLVLLDKLFTRFSRFANKADHYLIVLQRK